MVLIYTLFFSQVEKMCELLDLINMSVKLKTYVQAIWLVLCTISVNCNLRSMCFCKKSLSMHPFSTTACPALRVTEGCRPFQLSQLSQLSSCPTLDKSPVDQRAHAERQTTTNTYGQFIVVGQVRVGVSHSRIIFWKGKQSKLWFVMLVASDCRTEVTSCVCHSQLRQKVDHKVKQYWVSKIEETCSNKARTDDWMNQKKASAKTQVCCSLQISVNLLIWQSAVT